MTVSDELLEQLEAENFDMMVTTSLGTIHNLIAKYVAANQVTLYRDSRSLLWKLRQDINQANMSHDAVFTELTRRSIVALELSNADVCAGLNVSVPTYKRWLAGKNLPHPTMRKHVASWLLELLDAELNGSM